MTEVEISIQRKANGGERVSLMPILPHLWWESLQGRASNNLAGVATGPQSPIK